MMRRALAVFAAAAALGLVFGRPAQAIFHAVVIDELSTSYNGNNNEQFIEMRMLALFQNALTNSVFAAFDANGNYISDLLVVPGTVTNSGNNVRWLIATSQFQTANGVTADFPFPAGVLPAAGGMVCYGGGGGIAPAAPGSWSRTDFSNYVDCVAYGTYAGSSNALIGNPTPLDPVGHSLQRVSSSFDNATDFTCADPMTPKNNAGASVTLPATTPCGPPNPCPPAPDGGCLNTFAKGTVLVKDAAGKEKLLVKMVGGPATTQTDLGNPLSNGGTVYDLCIYDDAGSLVGSLEVDRAGDTCGTGPCWKALGGDPPSGKGYKYKDSALTAAGVSQILYKSGAVGKSKALVKGSGSGLPGGIPAALASSANATVQLRGSDATQCLSLTVTDIKKLETNFFKAKK